VRVGALERIRSGDEVKDSLKADWSLVEFLGPIVVGIEEEGHGQGLQGKKLTPSGGEGRDTT